MLRHVRDTLASSPFIYRKYLRYKHPTFSGQRPDFSQANCPLRTNADLESAIRIADEIGIPLHPDRPKNWDSLTALSNTLLRVGDFNTPILDAGGSMASSYLKSLHMYGFRDLTAVNLEFSREVRRGTIRCIPGDITDLPFPEMHFGAVFCQSVIEHGVSPDPFFREMRCKCRDDAVLILSTDYWDPKIYTDGLRAYGNPVNVFDRHDIEEWIRVGKSHGWETTTTPEFECAEQVVHWKRLDLRFTFYTLVMTRD